MNMSPDRKPVPGRAPYSQMTPTQYPPNVYPPNTSMAAPPVRVSPPMPQQPYSHTRRTPSVATSSSSNSASTNPNTQRTAPSNYASSVRRSTSSRSTSTTSPTSYVALMRKQKATVWCDRAQHEDPRILAAQRQAKMRATMEVAGSHNGGGRTSTSSSGLAGGMRSKIRHHGAVKASAYNAVANSSGAGVPMRLSATEVEEGDSDEEPRYHQRTGSGRSSLGSGQRAASNVQRGYSGASTPSAHSPLDVRGKYADDETPTSNAYGGQSDDYFGQTGDQGGSGSSGEVERNFGRPAGLPVQQRPKAEVERKTSDELRRRGSVDDRTMTMNAGRLFVANPDLSD